MSNDPVQQGSSARERRASDYVPTSQPTLTDIRSWAQSVTSLTRSALARQLPARSALRSILSLAQQIAEAASGGEEVA